MLAITVDNVSSNYVIDYMKMRIKDNDCTILVGEFLHMLCAVYISNIIVMDKLKDIYEFVRNI